MQTFSKRDLKLFTLVRRDPDAKAAAAIELPEYKIRETVA